MLLWFVGQTLPNERERSPFPFSTSPFIHFAVNFRFRQFFRFIWHFFFIVFLNFLFVFYGQQQLCEFLRCFFPLFLFIFLFISLLFFSFCLCFQKITGRFCLKLSIYDLFLLPYAISHRRHAHAFATDCVKLSSASASSSSYSCLLIFYLYSTSLFFWHCPWNVWHDFWDCARKFNKGKKMGKLSALLLLSSVSIE